jgi:hypothetical protein
MLSLKPVRNFAFCFFYLATFFGMGTIYLVFAEASYSLSGHLRQAGLT